MPPRSSASAVRVRTIFKGRVFTVEQERVSLGGDRTLVMDIVRHRGSVVLIPQPDARRVILIRQYRHVIGRTIWELPAGSLDPGEAPHHAARRECVEETGWRPRRLDRLAEYYPTPGFCDERMVFYRCADLVRPRHPVHQDPDEQIEPRTFTLPQAWALIGAGQIVDMKTVLGLGLISGHVPRVKKRQAIRERTSRMASGIKPD